MIRVALFDDSQAQRESLEALIRHSAGLEWAGGFSSCENLLHDLAVAQPDVVFMDIEMPFVDGLEGVKAVKKDFPHIKVIMLTAFGDDDKIFAALQNGAEGYILKTTSATQITQSIDDVMNGGAAMTPSIALRVMRYFKKDPVPAAVQAYSLTPKESEVLGFLADGLSYKMVADKMGISYFTVNNHVRKIYEKLRVHSLGEALALVHKPGKPA